MIDFNKPIQTRSGLRAELLATNASVEAVAALGVDRAEAVAQSYPDQNVVVRVFEEDGSTCIETYNSEGSFLSFERESGWDIVNVPERDSEFRTFNPAGGDHHVSGHQLGACKYSTLEAAQDMVREGWIGVLELIREDDKLVDVKFHA